MGNILLLHQFCKRKTCYCNIYWYICNLAAIDLVGHIPLPVYNISQNEELGQGHQLELS